MRWIVTGATGLIGRHLVPAIAASGQPVTAWSRTAATVRPGAGPLVSFRNVDLSVEVPLMDGEDDIGIVMLAAQISGSKDPADLPGLLATDTLPHAALAASLGPRLKHVVYASSCTVYGHIGSGASREDDPLRPLNAYAIAKAAGEFVLNDLARTQGFTLSVLRIAQVYGPGAPEAGAMYDFLAAAATGRPVIVTACAEDFRDVVHVDDVVRAILLTISERPAGVLNIGAGATRIVDVAAAALRAAGRADSPELLGKVAAGNMALDVSKAREWIGYAPTVTLPAGLRRELERMSARTT